jgi:hypothetical protein
MAFLDDGSDECPGCGKYNWECNCEEEAATAAIEFESAFSPPLEKHVEKDSAVFFAGKLLPEVYFNHVNLAEGAALDPISIAKDVWSIVEAMVIMKPESLKYDKEED